MELWLWIRRTGIALNSDWNFNYCQLVRADAGAPPSEFDLIGPNSLSEYEDSDEYRNILTVQAGLSVDPYSGQISTVTPVVQQQGGYTPLPLYPDGSRFYLGGKAINGIDSTVFNGDHTQVTVTVLAKFRVNLLENVGYGIFISLIQSGYFHRLAWAWAKISYTTNVDGQASAAFSGSQVPNQTDYWDYQSVGGYSIPGDIDDFLDADYGTLGPVGF